MVKFLFADKEGDKGTMKYEEFAKILNEEVQNMINKW